MTSGQSGEGTFSMIWEREEPEAKPIPAVLSRASIAQAALLLADREGLEAVSMRKVAGELKVGPMRLYAYIATKEEMLDLMIDEVYREMTLPAPHTAWHLAVTALAEETWSANERHPWFALLLGDRPHQGPHALLYVETLLTAIGRAPQIGGIDEILLASKTVSAYIFGMIQRETNERQTELRTGLSKEQWQKATASYMQRILETGRYPSLQRVFLDAEHPSMKETFLSGLRLVLKGLVASDTSL